MKKGGWRWLLWSTSIVVFLVIGFLWSRWTRIEDAGHWRIALSLLEWLAMLGAVFAFPNLKQRHALILLGVAAVVVRLAFWGAPVSNDVNRYLWEGRLLWEGENPYSTVADDEEWAHLRDEYWDGMNTRDRMTAYPPGMELVMSGASRLWYNLQVFKVVALVGDLWILALMVILAREYGRPMRWLGFYAFNPIVIASFAVEAHFDSLMVAPMLTALWFASRNRWKGAWFWLGFAVQMKVMALLVLPLFGLQAWRSLSGSEFKLRVKQVTLVLLSQAWPFVLVLILPCLVFWRDLGGMAYGFFAFGSQGAFNGGFYESLLLVSVPPIPARLLGTLLFGLGLLFVWRRFYLENGLNLFEASFWSFLLLLIFSPVVHFWYLSWIVWFLVLRPSASLIVLCGANSVYFLVWIFTELGRGWGYPREVVVVTWLPFFLLLLWENRFWKSRLHQISFPEATTVSLVVPVYREGESLPSFLEQLRSVSGEVKEIVVVDGADELEEGGSRFGAGIRVVRSERGRGKQIARGVAETSGDLVVIIHSDTQPKEGWVEEVFRAARKTPRAPAFALGQRFSKGGFGLLFVEFLNEMRVMFEGSVFGDQTMIIRRQALEQAGGFPEQPLMEDVEVSARLRPQGKILYLGREWTVSARKWELGFASRFRQIIGLMFRYGLSRMKGVGHAETLSDKLFEEYYGQKSSRDEE